MIFDTVQVRWWIRSRIQIHNFEFQIRILQNVLDPLLMRLINSVAVSYGLQYRISSTVPVHAKIVVLKH
jgi:hypothetical protein